MGKTIHRIHWKVVEQVLDKNMTEKEKALDKERGAAEVEDNDLVSSWLFVFDPVTQSVSKFLVISVTTFALMWKVPQERPSWIV